MSSDAPPPPPRPEDATEDLVDRARADLEGGFADLYGRIAPAVYAWASLHLRDPLRRRLDPEDVLQEVCCRAFQGFRGYDPERSDFRAWIFGIARNVLRQALRRLSKSRSGGGEELSLSSEAPDVPDTATSISRRVARQEQLTRFLERVNELPDPERLLLIYRGLEGLPHEQVGKLLGVPAKTSAKRWERLRERLKGDAGVAALLP